MIGYALLKAELDEKFVFVQDFYVRFCVGRNIVCANFWNEQDKIVCVRVKNICLSIPVRSY
jgi:hypothetical protein